MLFSCVHVLLIRLFNTVIRNTNKCPSYKNSSSEHKRRTLDIEEKLKITKCFKQCKKEKAFIGLELSRSEGVLIRDNARKREAGRNESSGGPIMVGVLTSCLVVTITFSSRSTLWALLVKQTTSPLCSLAVAPWQAPLMEGARDGFADNRGFQSPVSLLSWPLAHFTSSQLPHSF